MAGTTGRCTCGLLAVTSVSDKDEPGIPEPRQVGSFDLAKTEDEEDALVVTVHYFDGRPCTRFDRSARIKAGVLPGKPYPV